MFTPHHKHLPDKRERKKDLMRLKDWKWITSPNKKRKKITSILSKEKENPEIFIKAYLILWYNKYILLFFREALYHYNNPFRSAVCSLQVVTFIAKLPNGTGNVLAPFLIIYFKKSFCLFSNKFVCKFLCEFFFGHFWSSYPLEMVKY